MLNRLTGLTFAVLLIFTSVVPSTAFAPGSRAQRSGPFVSQTDSSHIMLPPVHIVQASLMQQTPVLQISKSGSPDPVTPGATLQYTIVYTNAGDATAQNVVITETYPANTMYLIASPPPPTGNNVWSLGNLPAGATGTIVVLVTVANELPVGTTLTNIVRIGAAQAVPAAFTETTQVNSAPAVTISKLDSADPVRVGDTLIYTIQYGNNGNAPVTGVRITETYPSRTTFVSANPPPNIGIGNNVWLTNTLGGLGQTRFIYVTMQVNSPTPDLTTLSNRVVIDTNETAPLAATQLTLVRSPVLALTKSASTGSPAANSVLTYTLRYTNSGSTYASNVVVTDAVPLNTTYLDCAPAGMCSPFGGTVIWNLGQVSSQTAGLLTLVVNVNDNLPNGTILTNTARISAAENVSAFVRITSTVSSAPMLSLSKSDSVSTAAAGNVLTYLLSYHNSGNAGAQGVVITDRIPSNVTFQSCAPSSSWVAVGGGVYSLTLGTVNASTGGVATLCVRVNSTLPAGLRSITNTARIQTTTPGDDLSDNFAQDVDTISTVPVLAISAAFDSATPYPTKIITYTLRYTNTSAMNTTGVVISATQSPYANHVPSGWTLVGGNVYLRSIGDLPAFAFGQATFVISLPFPYLAGTESFVNTFLIHDDGPGGLAVATDVETTILGVPDLVIDSVSLSPSGVITVGTKFTATVVIRNEGTGRACNPKAVGCGGFNLDVFIDPPTEPPSFGFSDLLGYGYLPGERFISSLNAGQTTMVTVTDLSFTPAQSFILYFKVDNWNCNDGAQSCIPAGAQHGLVPESDEDNNVFRPAILPIKVYLPIIVKNSP